MSRARRSFMILFLIAVLAIGGLTWSLAMPAGPATAAVFVVSALGLVVAIALDVRILLFFERHRVH